MAPNKTRKPKNNNRPAKDSRKKVAPTNNKESNRGRFSSMFSKETNATNNLNPQDGEKQKGEQPATTEATETNNLNH